MRTAQFEQMLTASLPDWLLVKVGKTVEIITAKITTRGTPSYFCDTYETSFHRKDLLWQFVSTNVTSVKSMLIIVPFIPYIYLKTRLKARFQLINYYWNYNKETERTQNTLYTYTQRMGKLQSFHSKVFVLILFTPARSLR